jgi:hypothetical protein
MSSLDGPEMACRQCKKVHSAFQSDLPALWHRPRRPHGRGTGPQTRNHSEAPRR